MTKPRCRLCGRFYAYQHHHTPDNVHCSRDCEEADREWKRMCAEAIERHNAKVMARQAISTTEKGSER